MDRQTDEMVFRIKNTSSTYPRRSQYGARFAALIPAEAVISPTVNEFAS